MCKACLCSACACSGTVSFSVLFCTLLSTFYLFFFWSTAVHWAEGFLWLSRTIPKAFCDLLPNNLDTHTMSKWKSLGETIPGLVSVLEMCLARNRGWMGRRDRPHVAVYFKICKWLATLSFCNILYQQLSLNNTTSYVLFWWYPEPPASLNKCLSHNNVDKLKIIFPASHRSYS